MKMDLTKDILSFIKKRKAVFYSDVVREFGISNCTVRDLIKILEKEGKVVVDNKGIAKLVVPAGDSNQEKS